MDDAIRYSLSTESRYEIEDVDAPAALGNSDTTAVVGAASGRTRSLAAPNNSHDFFDTFVRMDSYNTERFTFASGPNAILFGNSGLSGTIDTTFKRARPSRRFFEVSVARQPHYRKSATQHRSQPANRAQQNPVSYQ